MTQDDTKIQLSNGLWVMLKEIHTAPLISHWIWYRVGSRNESTGETGISHWVEHMQFKGTPSFPAGVLDKAISRDGGVWNAFTYLDWTTYFETMPADKIELCLQLEADRMCNSLFDPTEVESERTVIISELEGSENEPRVRLSRVVQRSSFHHHPYRNQIIGSLDDLDTITRDDLFAHYRQYYVPNNALLSIAGDFHTDEMLALVRKYYENIPMGDVPSYKPMSESFLESQKILELRGPGETMYLKIAYRSPAASHDDFFAYTVLDSLLTGPTNLNMFGGGISNKTSRLYRALVEKELAISVNGGLQATIDPFIDEIAITVHPNQNPEVVLRAVDQEIDYLQNTLVSEDEIARAAKQARALFVYGSENISNQAFWMGFSEMFDSYAWFQSYVDRIAAITPQDVQRIAQTYFRPSSRVIGVYLPEPEKGKEE